MMFEANRTIIVIKLSRVYIPLARSNIDLMIDAALKRA